MTDTSFYPVRLLARWAEAAHLQGLRFDVTDTPLPASFTQPGQYVQIKATPDGPVGYFAIAQPPGRPGPFEFLIKEAPEGAAGALGALAPGETVLMSPAQGRGYPLAGAEGRPVLLFAVGSGISPIRSLLWHLASRRAEFPEVVLFFGARTAEHLAYQGEFEAWEAEGIELVRVLSQASEPGAVRGYVQDALAAHPVDPARATAFVCGMKPMVEAVAGELGRRGMPAAAIHQNY